MSTCVEGYRGMNTDSSFVIKVVGDPHQQVGGTEWCVRVVSQRYGIVFEDILMFDTEQAAKYVFVGYKYDA